MFIGFESPKCHYLHQALSIDQDSTVYLPSIQSKYHARYSPELQGTCRQLLWGTRIHGILFQKEHNNLHQVRREIQFKHGEALEWQVTGNSGKMGVKRDTEVKTEVETRTTTSTGVGQLGWDSSLDWMGGRTIATEEPLPTLGCMFSTESIIVTLNIFYYISCVPWLCLNAQMHEQEIMLCVVFSSTLGCVQVQ